jgi:hypothetical protein
MMEEYTAISPHRELITYGILERLVKSGDDGVTQKELSNRLSVHRETIHENIKPLIKEGIVFRRGDKGKYFINPEYSSSHLTEGLLLNSEFLKRLGDELFLFQKASIVNAKKKIGNNMTKIDPERREVRGKINASTTYLRYIRPCFDNNSKLEKTIFEMVNQIGAYFMFVFIKTLGEYGHDFETDREQSKKVAEWLNYALGKFIVETYTKTIKILQEYVPNEQETLKIKEFIDDENLEHKEPVTRSVLYWRAYTNLYPFLYDVFTQKLQDLNTEIEYGKEIRKKRIYRKPNRRKGN